MTIATIHIIWTPRFAREKLLNNMTLMGVKSNFNTPKANLKGSPSALIFCN